mgnify:CR=1 FL=1
MPYCSYWFLTDLLLAMFLLVSSESDDWYFSHHVLMWPVCVSSNVVWKYLTGKLKEPTDPVVLHHIRQLETWIFRLLSAPVPVPGKCKLEVRTHSYQLHSSCFGSRLFKMKIDFFVLENSINMDFALWSFVSMWATEMDFISQYLFCDTLVEEGGTTHNYTV